MQVGVKAGDINNVTKRWMIAEPKLTEQDKKRKFTEEETKAHDAKLGEFDTQLQSAGTPEEKEKVRSERRGYALDYAFDHQPKQKRAMPGKQIKDAIEGLEEPLSQDETTDANIKKAFR